MDIKGTQIESTPRAHFLRRRVHMVSYSREPSVEARSTAQVLTLRTAEGLFCEFETDDTLQVFFDSLERLILYLAPLLVPVG